MRLFSKGKLISIGVITFSAIFYSIPVSAIGMCDFLSGDAGALCRAAARAAKERKRKPESDTGKVSAPNRDVRPAQSSTQGQQKSSQNPYLAHAAVLSSPLDSPPSKFIPYTSSADVELANKSLIARNSGNYESGYKLAQAACDGGVARGCFYEADYFDKGLFVSRNLETSAALYIKSCTKLNYAINEGCFAAGMRFELGQGVEKNQNLAIVFYKNGCATGESRSGSFPQSCKKYETLSSGVGNNLKVALSSDLNKSLTREEQIEAFQLPSIYANLCIRGNLRACYALQATVDGNYIDGLPWEEQNKKDVMAAMKFGCGNMSIKYRISYCYAYNNVRYHLAKLKGFPDPKDPRWCFNPAEQYRQMQQCLRRSDGSVDSCSKYSELSGYDVKNNCSYAVDYDVYGFNGGVNTVAPNGSVNLGSGEKFKWVAAHRKY